MRIGSENTVYSLVAYIVPPSLSISFRYSLALVLVLYCDDLLYILWINSKMMVYLHWRQNRTSVTSVTPD